MTLSFTMNRVGLLQNNSRKDKECDKLNLRHRRYHQAITEDYAGITKQVSMESFQFELIKYRLPQGAKSMMKK
jgi:hypothetical protein